MDKMLITNLLCGILAVILLWAAVVDIRTRTISNGLNLTIALMAPLFWWATRVDLWPDAAIRVGVGIAVLLLFALAFQIGAMGGGDVKLAAALALWFPPAATAFLLVLMSLAGGLLTIIVMIEHHLKKNEGRPEVPYGVAISFGGLWLVSQPLVNRIS